MNIGLLILVALGLVGTVVIAETARACLFISKREYAKALNILMRWRQDPSNIISPADLALLAIKTKDLQLADDLIQRDMEVGIHPLHITLQILLYGEKDDWQTAQESCITLQNLMKQNDTSEQEKASFNELKEAVENKSIQTLRSATIYTDIEASLVNRAKSLFMILSGVLGVVVIALIIGGIASL